MTIILEISFILFFPKNKKKLSRERSTTKVEEQNKKNIYFMLFIRSNDNYRKQTYLKRKRKRNKNWNLNLNLKCTREWNRAMDIDSTLNNELIDIDMMLMFRKQRDILSYEKEKSNSIYCCYFRNEKYKKRDSKCYW